MAYYVETSQYFTDKNQLFYFKCRKNWKRAGFKIKLFKLHIADDSHVKIAWLRGAVLSEHDILHFCDYLNVIE